MTLRVLVVDHTGKEGGGELALLRVVERLDPADVAVRALVLEDGPFVARLRAAGVDTEVLALDPVTNRASRGRILIPAVLARSIGTTMGFVPGLVRAIRRSGARIVVANTLKAAILVAVAAPLAGRPWVWHLHDRLACDYLPAPLVLCLRVLSALGPRRLVVNSEATLATLPGRARRKAAVAYPGLTADAFVPALAPDEPPIVGILGRVSPTKGQREFLSAAAIVAGSRADVRFRIIGAALFGEDDYEKELESLGERLGIRDRVDFTGWVGDPGAELRRLTVLVHASPVPEPFGQVIAEGMAAGVPVVATDAGGVHEMLDPEQVSGAAAPVRTTPDGVLVRPGNAAALAEAMTLVLDDTVAAAARAARARSTAAARFRIEHTVDVVREVWHAAGASRSDKSVVFRKSL